MKPLQYLHHCNDMHVPSSYTVSGYQFSIFGSVRFRKTVPYGSRSEICFHFLITKIDTYGPRSEKKTQFSQNFVILEVVF